jgi:hypothetical protein
VQVAGSLGLSVALSKSAVLAGPALLFPVWGPYLQAGLRNIQVCGARARCVLVRVCVCVWGGGGGPGLDTCHVGVASAPVPASHSLVTLLTRLSHNHTLVTHADVPAPGALRGPLEV